MFGYIKTDFFNLYVKDTVLYKAIYCGLCKGISKLCGQRGRMLLSYDLAFLSAFLHNVKGEDVDVKKEHCIIHPVSKRPVAKVDVLTTRISALNVILAKYKVVDDIIDNGRGRLKSAFINKAYKRAKKSEPILDKIVSEEYENLRKAEKNNSDSIDIVADSFANMMQRLVEELLDKNVKEDVSVLSYNLGKWVYLIDALDDFDKDIKRNNFNVFKNAYKEVQSKEQLLSEKSSDLMAVFGAILGEISIRAKNVEYKFNHDLLDNVFYRGLATQTKKIMENSKCKNSMKF